MLTAPRNSIYIWVNEDTGYAKGLARHLGRRDLLILGPRWLTHFNARSVTNPIRTDHALVLNSDQFAAMFEAQHREEALQHKAKR